MANDRHLEMAELLALRDGEGWAFARSHIEECERCRQEVERLHRLRTELRALPTFQPPRELWPRVAAKEVRRRWRRRFVYGGLGLAAAASLAGFLVLRGPAVEPAAPPDLWVAEATSRDLGPMINRSRQLESLLQVYAPQSQVYDAPTALAVSVLEDRIVLLDRMLTHVRTDGADREVLRGLWGERVLALEQLASLQLAPEPTGVWR
jgi:hypothetical protein